MESITILRPPKDLEEIFETLFTEDLKEFVVKICRKFDEKIDRIFLERAKRRLKLEDRELNYPNESLKDLSNFIEEQFTGCY